MSDTRLIERWLPIAALGEESIRERRSMTALPPIYYLHVWWARRPLVASRAAVLASLLSADADRDRFLHAIGIHGDPAATRRKIDAAKRTKENLGLNPYGYKRAFKYTPTTDDRRWIEGATASVSPTPTVLDPTAGGGSIPVEIHRLGHLALANDLNPVAALILKATVEWPRAHGSSLRAQFDDVAREFVRRAKPKYDRVFPAEPDGVRVDGYLWARTVTCLYCDGLVPLSPNWRVAPDGTGIRLEPRLGDGPGKAGRICSFGIVTSAAEQSPGTVARGNGICPYTDCGRVFDGDEIKRQAQAGRMGDQLYAVVYKERVQTTTKTGRVREKWVRRYRAPRPADDNGAEIEARLADKLPEWEAFDLVPSEPIPDGNKTTEPRRYGMNAWRDLFSPRQLLCHGISAEVFREMLDADVALGRLDELRKAAYGYLALALDTLLNYNNRAGRWDNTTGRVRSIFDRHDFAFVWSYAEMAPLVAGVGYDWAIEKTAKCIDELVALVRPEGGTDARSLLDAAEARPTANPAPVTITCKSGDNLDHIEDGSVDVVVMDPPYYDNVMYAELSDFFYVWLKRTAGHVFPELFRRHLTDKENEAVANPARFAGQPGAKALAGRDYQQRMAAIFAECRRVLKADGVMTLMFTHKATGAWDALTTGLIEAGFIITASWPVNTEAEGSLHIKDKAAANSTIFLVCRPRETGLATAVGDASAVREAPPAYGDEAPTVYWEDVEPGVARAVRLRVEEFQEAGIGGVDLYLASFGPALEEFSRHWPLRRGTPREKPAARRRQRQRVLFEEDPGTRTRLPRRRPRRRAARGEALASGPTDACQGGRRPGSVDGVLRAGLGRLSCARVCLRRGAAAGARGRCRPGHGRRRPHRGKEGEQPASVGQRATGGSRCARTGRRIARDDRRASSRGVRGSRAIAGCRRGAAGRGRVGCGAALLRGARSRAGNPSAFPDVHRRRARGGGRGVRRRLRGALQPVPLCLSRPDRRARSVATVAGRELTDARGAQVEAQVHA